MIRVCLFRYYKYVRTRYESAAVCVYILLLELLLLLLLLLLLVIVHLAPEVFFIEQQYLSSIFIASCTNERSSLLKHTPWQNSRFCAASALPIIISYQVPLFANTGMREAAGGRQPAAAKPPRIQVIILLRYEQVRVFSGPCIKKQAYVIYVT